MNIIFFNHSKKNCGVYQYGYRMYNILKKSQKNNYFYEEIDNFNEYESALNKYLKIDYCIFNFHNSTMSWLNKSNIKPYNNFGILHESTADFFDKFLNINPDAPEDYFNVSLPRPLFEDINIEETPENIKNFIEAYTTSNLPIFGSFGFGFENKGFDKIVEMVNEQYDEAVIKLIITIPHFCGNNFSLDNINKLCKEKNRKPGIILMISHDFFSNNDILKFLNSNTMNIFLYDKMEGRGISSVIDYSLIAKKPIGISDSYMFRNIYSDKICLYKVSISECLNNSLEHCKIYLDKYSNKNLIDKFDNVICNNFIETKISVGEALLKYSVLENEMKKITNNEKIKIIENELKSLSFCENFIKKYKFWYNLLLIINDKIFEMNKILNTTNVKDINFGLWSNEIFEFYKKRIRIKKIINSLSGSVINEYQDYEDKCSRIIIEDIETFYDKLPEINYLSLDFDYLVFDKKFEKDMRKIYKTSNYIFSDDIFCEKVIEIKLIILPNEIRDLFEFIPIKYIAGGLLGDFINQLSIICEKFYETGKKGILYASMSIGDKFRLGIEKFYNDTYDIIKGQKYIKDFLIHDENDKISFDINLSDWRYSFFITRGTWSDIFKEFYQINFGKHKWIYLPVNDKFKDIIFITDTSYRSIDNIDFKKLLSENTNKYIFLTDTISHYEYFKNKHNIDLEIYMPNSFFELAVAINSCKLFVGTLSANLTIATACYKDLIIGCPNNSPDMIHNSNFNTFLKNVEYGLK